MPRSKDDSSEGGFQKIPRKRKPVRDKAPRPHRRGQQQAEPHIPVAEPPVGRKENTMPKTIAPSTPTPAPKVTMVKDLRDVSKLTITHPLAHPNDPPEMKALLDLAILPPMKVDGQDNPEFRPARDKLRNAMNAVDGQDLSRKLNLFAQRAISGTATWEEVSAMFGLYTAQGRRWHAHDVLAVQKAVAAIKTSRPALNALLNTTFVALTLEGQQVRNLARQVPNTTYVSYSYSGDALPAYLKVLKASGLTDAAVELERHIGDSNMRAVLAQQRKAAAKEAEAEGK